MASGYRRRNLQPVPRGSWGRAEPASQHPPRLITQQSQPRLRRGGDPAAAQRVQITLLDTITEQQTEWVLTPASSSGGPARAERRESPDKGKMTKLRGSPAGPAGAVIILNVKYRLLRADVIIRNIPSLFCMLMETRAPSSWSQAVHEKSIIFSTVSAWNEFKSCVANGRDTEWKGYRKNAILFNHNMDYGRRGDSFKPFLA